MADQNLPDPAEATISELIAAAQDYKAGIIKVISRDATGKPTGLVVVCNEESTPGVLSAIEEVEDEWVCEHPDEPADVPAPSPVPVRIKLTHDGQTEHLVGELQVATIDASFLFGEGDAMELVFTPSQLAALFTTLVNCPLTDYRKK